MSTQANNPPVRSRRSLASNCRWRRPLFFFGLVVALLPGIPGRAKAAQPVDYVVDLRSPESHVVQVTMTIPDAAADTKIQIPAWNCLYQIRDFVKNVQDLRGKCAGKAVDLERDDLNTWSGPGRTCSDLVLRYAVLANTEGPFDSVLNAEHGFLNLAMVLFFVPTERARPVRVEFRLPSGWKLATQLAGDGSRFESENYDALVDSPVEAGHFEELTYQQDLPSSASAPEPKQAAIRVIIDANRADYSPDRILNSLKPITAAETALMQDLPFHRYTFILHFPRDGGSTGGMEHRDGTAIAIPASDMRINDSALENVAAHELFHAWNVKRIRPRALEPVDYTNGNDTRDLWFCEGVTSTYAELTLLRAGLINRSTFYDRLASAIKVLESRSARFSQSAETSGREAWLEKYSDYNRPERSVSYYNKGELLGYLLDLGMRQSSQNAAGLDDVMRRLNRDFARQGRFYTLGDLAAIVSQLAPRFDATRFFAEDVRGTAELDYSAYLKYAGLRYSTATTESPVAGFTASRQTGGRVQVDFVDPESDAERAGLELGDTLIAVNGKALPAGQDALPIWRPRQKLELQVERSGENRSIKFHVGASTEISIRIEEDSAASPDQLRVREGWLKGVTHPAQP